MIPSLRIDDRLIHGQIALVWSKAFGTNRIAVSYTHLDVYKRQGQNM